jgi:hypothetical protein
MENQEVVEIEITEEMVFAGAEAFDAWFCDDPISWDAAKILLPNIFRAMRVAEPANSETQEAGL